MLERSDVEAVAGWFMERERLLFETIVAFLRAEEKALALELLERELTSTKALIHALAAGDGRHK